MSPFAVVRGVRLIGLGWSSYSDDRVAQHITPVGKALVRHQDEPGALIETGDEAEEQAGFDSTHGQIGQLVQRQEQSLRSPRKALMVRDSDGIFRTVV